jgi:hypothetical protein
MRKVLIGVLVVCISLGLASAAMADFTTSSGGEVSFGVFGDQPCCSCGDCQFYFSGGACGWYKLEQTCGPWGGQVTAKWDSGEDPVFFIDAASLWYDGGTWMLTAYPLGVDQGVFDIEDCWGDGMKGIPSNPGLKFETSADAFDLWLIVNNSCKCENTPEWNFAGGVGFDMDGLGIDFVYNNDQECGNYSSWGLKGTYAMDSLSLTGEYGAINYPWGDTGYGWYGNLTWGMDSGDSVSLTYRGGDETYSCNFSKICGEYTHVLDSCMNLVLGVESVNGCCSCCTALENGTDSETYWWAKLVCTIG